MISRSSTGPSRAKLSGLNAAGFENQKAKATANLKWQRQGQIAKRNTAWGTQLNRYIQPSPGAKGKCRGKCVRADVARA
eukprot:3797186-Lingulodinium_polyedra.AAC.1